MSSAGMGQKAVRFLQLLVRIVRRDPRDMRHVFGMALHAAEQIADPETDVRSLPALEIEKLSPSANARITTLLFSGVPASVSLPEAFALGLLLRRLAARRVFEFGTYKGVSTTQLALNLEAGGEIFTLDLPEEDQPRYELTIDKPSERDIAAEHGKGALIPDDLRPAITFLRQDSARFDPAPYASTMDFVFVDGAHSADYVRNDSEKGWAMLRPGGIIVWHDCLPNHPDVMRYVRSCGFGAQRVAGTSLAMAIKPGQG